MQEMMPATGKSDRYGHLLYLLKYFSHVPTPLFQRSTQRRSSPLLIMTAGNRAFPVPFNTLREYRSLLRYFCREDASIYAVKCTLRAFAVPVVFGGDRNEWLVGGGQRQ